jgi:branched-chain amino acid transport system ATP-binding protein
MAIDFSNKKMVVPPSNTLIPERDSDKSPVLDVRNLGIDFGGLRAVDDFTITIGRTEIAGLIGPNGAGKTTVFNLLTNVYQPTRGAILLNGTSTAGKKPDEVNRMGIARTFQNIRLFNSLTVLENVMVGLANQISCNMAESIFRLPRHKKTEREFEERALELLKLFKLDEFKDYKAANLPYGKQRRLEIARAMATNPQLLLLDEPAAGMNPHETEELMEDIAFIRKEFDMTILLIEHDMSLVSGICENVTVLNFGTELASGETAKVLSNPAVVKAYLGD